MALRCPWLSVCVAVVVWWLILGVQAVPAIHPTPEFLCGNDDIGIKFPRPGDHITQVVYKNGSTLEPTFRLIYCSREYFKTRSLSIDVLLSNVDNIDNGQVLAMNKTPTLNGNIASPGRFGYYVNVTVPPTLGSWPQGQRTVTVYEKATGYYYPYQYHITRANYTFEINRPQG